MRAYSTGTKKVRLQFCLCGSNIEEFFLEKIVTLYFWGADMFYISARTSASMSVFHLCCNPYKSIQVQYKIMVYNDFIFLLFVVLYVLTQ